MQAIQNMRQYALLTCVYGVGNDLVIYTDLKSAPSPDNYYVYLATHADFFSYLSTCKHRDQRQGLSSIRRTCSLY